MADAVGQPKENVEAEALRHLGTLRRVVCLVPSAAESLFELGCGDRLKGITQDCIHPADQVAGVARVGESGRLDLDRVQAIVPDLVIANPDENRPQDIAALEQAGFRVWSTRPRTARAALDLLWDFIRVFEVPHMAPALSSLEKAYEWASLAARNTPPVKVFCPIGREPDASQGAPRGWLTAWPPAYLHDALQLCGAEDIFAGQAEAGAAGQDARVARVTSADVAARAPQVILLPGLPGPFLEADLSALDDFPEIPAVRDGRIMLVDGSLLTYAGIRLSKLLSSDLPAKIAEAREMGA